MNNEPQRTEPTKAEGFVAPRIGRGPAIAFWVLLLGFMYWGFEAWFARQLNPNTAAVLATQSTDVILRQNLQGRYVAAGSIDGKPVTFLVDTGADAVAVSTARARALGLKRGAVVSVATAGGMSTGYETRLDRIKLGAIELADVRALIIEGMDDDVALLGMTFLRRVEFSQREGVLTLRPITAR